MLTKLYKIIRNSQNEVCWLSHHIPKTAGTSLANTYVNQFGKRNLYRLYNPDKIKVFERTGKIEQYTNELIVHGHFKPRVSQSNLSRDIRRIVWVRDPVQRAWSMLHHLVAVQKHKVEYRILNDYFGEQLNQLNEDIFLFYLTDHRLKHLNRPYSNYFSEVPLIDFDFVGKVESYDSDLLKLSDLMGAQLGKEKRNIRKGKLSIDSQDFKCHLENEYEIMANYYSY